MSDKLIYFRDWSGEKIDVDSFEYEIRDEELVEFFNDDAKVCVEGMVSTIKTIFDDESNFIGYFAITMSSVRAKELFDEKRVAPFPHPALLLGRLLLCKDCRGKGIGSRTIQYIVMLAQKLNMFVACRFIAVDSKLHAVDFYKANGFVEVGYEGKNRGGDDLVPMLFDLKV